MVVAIALVLACAASPPARKPIPDAPGVPCSRRRVPGTEQFVDEQADNLEQAFPVGEKVVSRSRFGEVVLRSSDGAIERVLAESGAATIGQDGNVALVGFKDGRTAWFDSSSSWAIESGPKLAGTPVWIGGADGRRIAVGLLPIEPARERRHAHAKQAPGHPLGALDPASATPNLELRVVDLKSGRERVASLELNAFGPRDAPSAVLVFGHSLFIGWDWGEWGGARARIDLEDGSILALSGQDPVYGWSRIGDEVWVHGGGMHMGSVSAFIETTTQPSRRLYDAGNYDPSRGPGPIFPITDILQGPGDALTVLAYNGIWRTRLPFADWRKVENLDLRYSPGRPDAIGTYPAVTSAWIDARGRLVFATRGNGLCVAAAVQSPPSP